MNTYIDKVSIPRSGFCPFRPGAERPRRRISFGFNPSFGILPIQTCSGACIGQRCSDAFQSLVRDSAHSDYPKLLAIYPQACGFNPSFGILPIQT